MAEHVEDGVGRTWVCHPVFCIYEQGFADQCKDLLREFDQFDAEDWCGGHHHDAVFAAQDLLQVGYGFPVQ